MSDDDFKLPPDMTPEQLRGVSPELLRDGLIRVSQRGGRTGSKFVSPHEQVETIQRMALAHGTRIARWFDESDSVSGGTTDREGLQTAMGRAVVLGVTGGIYVAKLDRFCRNFSQGARELERLDSASKELMTDREGILAGPNITATGKLIRNVFLSLAEWERETRREGFASNTDRHIARGIATNAPYGWVKDAVTRRLVPEPVEAPFVIEMFRLRAKDVSWQGIADWCNEQPECTPRRGKGWTKNSVRQIVQSRVHLGEIKAGDDCVNEHAHEPLIDAKLWGDANRSYTVAKRQAGQFLLTGIIRCASCSGLMGGMNHTKGGKVYSYYRCRIHSSHGKCAAPARIRAELADEAAERAFAARYMTGAVEPTESTDALEAAKSELAAADAALSSYLDSDEVAAMAEDLGQDWFAQGLRPRRLRVRDARDRVAQATNAALGVELPSDLASLWPTLDTDQRRGFLVKGLEVVAVEHGTGDLGLWTRGDPDAPSKLLGQDGNGGLVTINLPSRTLEAAG